jgi:hypothetical protein
MQIKGWNYKIIVFFCLFAEIMEFDMQNSMQLLN